MWRVSKGGCPMRVCVRGGMLWCYWNGATVPPPYIPLYSRLASTLYFPSWVVRLASAGRSIASASHTFGHAPANILT